MRNNADEPVYVISIAAAQVGVHPQTLRLYEREGLVMPARRGNNRLYSDADIERLRQIQRFTQELGVNLAGVGIILDLLEKNQILQAELDEIRQTNLPVPMMTDDPLRR